MVSFPGWINFLPGNCIWEICRLSAHNWTGCFSLQVPNHYSWVKNSLSLPCKDWSDLYINDVVINQSDRLLERSAHINNLWYLSNIPPCSGLQNELFFFLLCLHGCETPWRADCSLLVLWLWGVTVSYLKKNYYDRVVSLFFQFYPLVTVYC